MEARRAEWRPLHSRFALYRGERCNRSLRLNMFKYILISLGAGCITGYIYGLLFFQSRRGVPSLRTHIFFSLARFCFLLAAGIYLLQLPSIQPITLVLSFLATFWLVILRYKFHGYWPTQR